MHRSARSETPYPGKWPEWRFEVLHQPDLPRGRVRPQQVSIFEPEGVLHVPCWVIRRDVQRLEVIVLGLYFGVVEEMKPIARNTSSMW